MNDRITWDEARKLRREEAGRVKVGDLIPIRGDRTAYPIDENDEPDPEPDYYWEPVEVAAVLPPTSSDDVVADVTDEAGHTRRVVLTAIIWRPLTPLRGAPRVGRPEVGPARCQSGANSGFRGAQVHAKCL